MDLNCIAQMNFFYEWDIQLEDDEKRRCVSHNSIMVILLHPKKHCQAVLVSENQTSTRQANAFSF